MSQILFRKLSFLFYLIIAIFFSRVSFAQVTISEVMYNPASSDNDDEYVEIYNLSDSTVDLSGWVFSDSLSQDFLVDAGRGMQLNAKRYAVILDGSYFGNSTTYDNIIPDSVLIIKVDDNSLGSGGLSNSNAKRLSLLDDSLNIVDEYKYRIGFKEGYSNEKINISAGNDPSNWAQSLVLGGTPGTRNSVTPFDYDMGFDKTSLQITPSGPITTTHNVNFALKIFNLGIEPFSGDFSLRLFIDGNNDSSFSVNDILLYNITSSADIEPEDSTEIQTNYAFEKAGIYNCIAEIYDLNDQNPLNNFIAFQLTVLDNSPTLHINEIKFLTFDNEPEWLELYNSGNSPVALQNWAIADERDTARIDSFAFIQPNQYKILAADPGIDVLYGVEDSLILILHDLPNLNNSGDVISLLNPLNNVREKVPYSDDWLKGEQGRKPSLERINVNKSAAMAENWGPSTAAAGATPGRPNSVLPFDRDIGFSENSVMLTPSGKITTFQSVHFQFMIYNFGLEPFSGNFSFQLFIDADNNSSFSAWDILLYTVTTSAEINTNDSTIINANYTFEKAGIYNCIAEIYDLNDQNPLNNFVAFKLTVLDNSPTLHINEIKFLTFNNEPEWLELYNSGDRPVALQNWAIADKQDTAMIDTLAFIQPNQYKVISSNTGLDTLYSVADSQILVLKGLPSLNNTDDVVSLLGPLDNLLEQVPYSIDWLEGEQWRNPSLERINVNLDARLARNWGPSTAIKNATPAERNAIFAPFKKKLKSKLEISPNPFSPDGDGLEDHTLIHVSLPTRSARIKVQIFDILGRKIRTLTDNSFSGSQATLVWDGKHDSGRRACMGIYIVFVQILNDREGVIKEFKKTVVVAGKL